MQTIQANGKTYRIKNSVLPSDENSPFRNAFNLLGISDMVNALPPRARSRVTQLFIWQDGRVTEADSRIVSIAARMASPRVTERKLTALLIEAATL